MEDKDGVYGYAKYVVYSSFYIGGSSNDYTLHILGHDILVLPMLVTL